MSKVYVVMAHYDNCAKDKEDFDEFNEPIAAFYTRDAAKDFMQSTNAISAVKESRFFALYVLGGSSARTIIIDRCRDDSNRIIIYGGYYNQMQAWLQIKELEVKG